MLCSWGTSKEAQAFAAEAAGDADNAVKRLKEAVAIEDSIDDLSQPPYPVIPATELSGNLLLDLNRPTEAVLYFRKTLLRTPNRPKAIFGLARAAQALGDNATARERYQEFLSIWKDADPDRPEIATAKEFLAKKLIREKSKSVRRQAKITLSDGQITLVPNRALLLFDGLAQ